MNFTGLGNTLLDSMVETCTMIEKRTVLDEVGGYKQMWVDGVEFPAVIRKDDSIEAKLAEKQGVTELYTIIVQKGFPLDYHDVLRRGTGEILRVTSNIADKQTPSVSTINVAHVTAERWVLPDV